MGDSSTYQFPVALQWPFGPEKLKQIKNKLLAYFQSKNKSNGGECKMKDMDCTKGYILIFFNQETVRDSVLQKESHRLTVSKGNTLNLTVNLPQMENSTSTQEALQSGHSLLEPATSIEPHRADSEAQDYPSSLVLIENLQDSCTMQMLNRLLENISEKEESRDFHVEMIPEIHAAVVTFTCEIDIKSFLRDFSVSLRVNQQKITAMDLEETRSIRVEGLPSSTSEDHISIYFDSQKHGGGSIQEVMLLPEEDAALITFQDKTVTRMVLTHNHVFGNTPVSVYPYYPSIGVTLYGKKGPSVTIPAPLEFPVSPYILEFILSDAQRKLNIEEKMATLHCEVTWPDLSCQTLVIKLCVPDNITSRVRTLAKIAPTWRDKVFTEFSLIISKYRVTEHSVSGTVWEAIQNEVGSSAYDGVLIKPDLAKGKVFLTGILKDITQVEPAFTKLIETTTGRINREMHSITEELMLAPPLYQIMSRNGLEKSMEAQFPKLTMSYDGSSKKLKLCGLKEEVYGSKCKILEMEKNLNVMSVHLDPHIVQFLKKTSSDEMSSVIFIPHNIYAMLNMEGDIVKLVGSSTEQLSMAVKQIKQELACKKVTVEDKSIITNPEWDSLKQYLQEVFNSEKCTFLIQQFPTGAENQVVISGLNSVVGNIFENVYNFVLTNTPMEKDVEVKSMAVMHFIMDETIPLWEDIRKTNVKTAMKQRKITLTGPKVSVLEASGQIEKFLSSLYTHTLCINKPGAKTFCRENDEVHIAMAKNKFKCALYLEKDEVVITNASECRLGKLHYQVTLSDGVTIEIYNDDLTRHRVDVIVNAANEDLKHIGGLAQALLQAAGPKLQSDSDHFVREKGKLSTGDSVITDAGNLPCKQVIHTVGPKWDASSAQRCDRLLRKAITRSLELAAEKGHSSIAIPAVSAGIFGFPLKRCVKNITEAIREYLEDYSQRSSLKSIHLVDTDMQTVQIFTELVRANFGDKNTDFNLSTIHSRRTEESENLPVTVNTARDGIRTRNGLTIQLAQQNIQDTTTDVVVNSVGSNLDLNNGGSSKALFTKAGQNLQVLLDNESQGTQVQQGSMFVTDGCNHHSKKVIHVVIPQWDNGQGSSEKVLKKVIKNCLLLTEQERLQSIGLPALGTGNLRFPKPLAAALMFDVVSKFSRKNDLRYLQEVNIILFPSDTDTIQAFSDELEKHSGASSSNGKSTKAASGNSSLFFGTVTTPDLGIYEMTIGPITYQVKTGDITSENQGIIVNSSNQNFTLQTGVSQAILAAAGPKVIQECALLGSQPHKGFIKTNSGNLQCQYIIHTVGQAHPRAIKQLVLDVLQECDRLRVTSVSFPAIGTGAGRVPAALVADAMLDAVADFVKNKSVQWIQTVKVIIFQQPMLNDFYSSMKQKEGSAVPQPQSIFQKITSWIVPPKSKPPQKLTAFQLMDNIEPANFQLCAGSETSLRDTESWLENRILHEQTENVITDEWIADFEVSDRQKFSELQKRLQVCVEYKPASSTVRVSGLTRDVMHAVTEINSMISKLKDKKNKEREADLLSNMVEWTYQDGAAVIPFDKFTNLELENADRQKTTINVSINRKSFTVNTQSKSATDNQGNSVTIKRVNKHEEQSFPQHWDSMGNKQVKEVPLNPSSQEYVGVQAQFAKTCPMRIHKIERIQNKPLWQSYQIRKQAIDSKNGSTNNEKQLFHGTRPDTLQHVNHNGFNRSYAGRNAAMIGNGTYFAVDARYSASDTYSRPDSGNRKYMYLARVITGVFCTGSGGMIMPPAKNPANPTDLYDSATDNPVRPSMYVIFNDVQAYPEYLITFSQ
ncbi:protein mono-ADP-ribosyltransferase PARP14-like [Pelodytes ibericus]